jgi:hypothetical protein
MTTNSYPYALGRIVEHDERSLQFSAARATKLVDVEHVRHAAPFDQGQLGSCTGNAIAGALMTEPLWNSKWALTEKDAVTLYEKATTLDDAPGSYPPDDTGSSGLAACKAAKALGYITAYHHAFGLQHALEALVLQPVITGITWYESMFTPTAAGECVISANSEIAGGHELELNKLVVKDQQVWFVNSWGSSWGVSGRGWFSFDTFERLLSEQGDVTVPVIKSIQK